MHLDELQSQIGRIYGEKDAARGVDGTFFWFISEVGELASALREGRRQEMVEEMGDVLAWLATLANVVGVSLEEACQKYASACNKCGKLPCVCQNKP